ncbi:MAG: FAD-dependent monooxygenase [Pseudomonadota bacterium]
MNHHKIKPHEITTEIAIAGAGLVGMVLALMLVQQGFSVKLIDRADPRRFCDQQKRDGRASALALGNLRRLHRLGLAEPLARAGCPISDIRIADGHPYRGISKLFLHFNAGESDHQPSHQQEAAHDSFGIIIENNRLRAILAEQAAHLDIIAPASVVGFDGSASSACLRLDDGRVVKARLCIAADGGNSTIRQLAAIAHSVHDYQQTALVMTVQHEHDHAGTAVELFLPSGPFAMLPMPDRCSNIVWTEHNKHANALMQMEDTQFMGFVRERFGNWLGKITLVSQRFGYPVRLLQAHQYHASRLVLVGDAAHAIHPIAGQGLNLGLRGAARLADLLCEYRAVGLDPGSALFGQTYQRRHHPDAMALIAATHAINALFSNDIQPVRTLRDLGLVAVGQIPALKRFFMHHAMGLHLDANPAGQNTKTRLFI